MTPAEIKQLQARLNGLGYDSGAPDGDYGKRTTQAVKDFQSNNGLVIDGDYGSKTAAVLLSGKAKPFAPIGSRPPAPVAQVPPKAAQKWPTQAGVRAFYGEPGNPQCTAGKCILPIPFRIAWDVKQSVKSFSCHSLVAASMTDIFAKAVKHYGEDRYRKLGLDLFGGCYNLRKMRGGSSYSMHSWGIAVDLDPANNSLYQTRGNVDTRGIKSAPATFSKPEYADFWAIVEEAGAISLGLQANYDWMHFQFARL